MSRPKPQELYRHFKGGRYQVITIAKEADSGEEKVVYQALYGDYTVYCRPLSEFVSEVDRQKYPNADQKMRFERFYSDPGDNTESENDERRENRKTSEEKDNSNNKSGKQILDDLIGGNKDVVKPQKEKDSDEENHSNTGDYMNRTIEQEAEDFGLNPLVVRFLDADSSTERLEVLNLIRPIVTNEMIDVMAMAIDTEVSGDDPDERCAELRECLITKQRFEVTRLRS